MHIEGELALQSGNEVSQGQLEEGVGTEGERHSKQREENMQLHGDIEECRVHLRTCRYHWFWLECWVEMEEWWKMRKRGNAEKAEARSFVLSFSRCLWNVYCVPRNELLDTGLLPLHYLSPVSFSGSSTWVYLLNITESQDTALSPPFFSTYIFSLGISFGPLYLNIHYT